MIIRFSWTFWSPTVCLWSPVEGSPSVLGGGLLNYHLRVSMDVGKLCVAGIAVE